MIRIFKQKMIHLVNDESGVALAFTLTVSLIIFLFGFAIYAVGETVRERIELQNAADAAAYSGALVQADTISRIAVINKAMSWNYVMMTRRQMDHIVDSWLGKVTSQWYQYRAATQAYQNICACHPRMEGVNWRVGISPGGVPGDVVHRLIRINGTQDVFIPAIESARAANAARNPLSLLNSLRQCAASMNRAEKELISGLKKRIENAVEYMVKSNVSLTENDKTVKNQRKIQWALYDLKDASIYFEQLRGDEKRFFGFGDFSGSPQTVLGTGADTWLKLNSGSGFQRNYTQAGNTLSAVWFTYNQIWWHTTYCVFGGVHIQPASTVTGEMARDNYFTGQEACPQVLKSNYFEKDGAIIAGVSRPLNNPFSYVFGGGEKSGIYAAFTTGGGSQTMWCVSGARAGYRLNSWKKGEYSNRRNLSTDDNLRITDWDAMFLPLAAEPGIKNQLLAKLAQKLGATNRFAGRDYTQSGSNIDFSNASNHLYH
ncbi:MAG: hypothetical protein J5858_10075 [Lentisphaeria bacterium]|nr:hypothetical protein [Lentisphaeria bacterium]